MRVNYNGVELQNVRERSLRWFAEKDPAGTDNIYTRVELEVSFVWSPYATSSTAPGAHLVNNDGLTPGDSLGLSIRNLRKYLSEPRKTLLVAFGGDTVWQCPVPVNGATLTTQAGQQRPQCDPGLGPIPEVVSVVEVVGDKMAVGVWKVTFWVLDSPNILLSNRWTVTCTVNDAGLTTRHIQGWAQCRADAVASGQVNGVDDFRKWFVVKPPAGFRRTGCRVQVNDTNTQASYYATDIETCNPLGADGATIGAVKFSGEFTGGIISVNKTVGQQARGALELGIAAVAGFLVGGPAGAAFGGAVALANQLPTIVSKGRVKVVGGKNASKLGLMKLAVAIAMDRFFDGSVVALTVTQGVGESENAGRWVQVEAVFVPTLANFLASAGVPLGLASLPSFIPALTNLSNDISTGNAATGQGFLPNGQPLTLPGDVPTPANENSPRYQSFNFGPAAVSSNNTRGSWLGAMICQSLQSQGQVPAAPPSNQVVQDAALS